MKIQKKIQTWNWSFYIVRLRNAPFPELADRLRQALMVIGLRNRLIRNSIVFSSPLLAASARIRELKPPSLECNVDSDKVGKILAGETFTLGANKSCLAQFENRNRGIFFADIKAQCSDDIRAFWEPARLQNLAILTACILEGREDLDLISIRSFVRESVLQWLGDNPFLCGPHYMSAMECGLRIPVFFYCLKCLEFTSESEYQRVLKAVYLHAWWIFRRLSLYSSLGNHTICECVGLVFAGAIFRNTAEGTRWFKSALAILKRELHHQILDDGGPAEQSLGYHRFILDLYWLTVDFLEKNELFDCSDFKPQLMRAESFLDAFEDHGGYLPALGDSDDGYAVAPNIAPDKIKMGGGSGKDIHVFERSGYTVITTQNRVLLTFDHGPLGMPPLYNHGHADALSLTLSKDGEQILVDPGTYRYNGEPPYRKYFKGTRAHNTVTVDGLDQAVQETGFIWSRPFSTELFRAFSRGDGFLVEAGHNGYSRLHEPVTHRRTILFFGGINFLCKDTFSGQGVHGFELNFHLHPDSCVKHLGEWWEIEKKGRKIFIMLFGQYGLSPVRGWYAPVYGTLLESTVLSSTRWGTPDEIIFTTVICTETTLDERRLNGIAADFVSL
jgi:hypothetical protein